MKKQTLPVFIALAIVTRLALTVYITSSGNGGADVHTTGTAARDSSVRAGYTTAQRQAPLSQLHQNPTGTR